MQAVDNVVDDNLNQNLNLSLQRLVTTDFQSSSQYFPPVSLHWEWLIDSHFSTKIIYDEAAVNSGWIS